MQLTNLCLDLCIIKSNNIMKDYLKIIGYALLTIFILSIVGIVVKSCNKAQEATHIQDAVENYEEFQSIYNTCSKLNTDLCYMKELPDSDIMFQQFSKAQRINTIRTQLNRWVEEYNAKSNMWGRSLWKSSKLPYQLSVNQFSCNQ